MPLSISFELSDRDLEHFTTARTAARASAAHKTADDQHDLARAVDRPVDATT